MSIEHYSFHIPRSQMPQIDKEHIPTFINYVKERTGKLVVSKANQNPTSMKPTQNEFDMDKVVRMGSSNDPIIVSADDYVLDGHHRWLANCNAGAGQPVLRLPVGAAEGLRLMREFPLSYTKQIHEDGAAAVSIGGGAMSQEPAVKPSQQPKAKKFKQWLEKSLCP